MSVGTKRKTMMFARTALAQALGSASSALRVEFGASAVQYCHQSSLRSIPASVYAQSLWLNSFSTIRRQSDNLSDWPEYRSDLLSLKRPVKEVDHPSLGAWSGSSVKIFPVQIME